MKKKIALCITFLCSIFVNAQNVTQIQFSILSESAYIPWASLVTIECWTMNADSSFALVKHTESMPLNPMYQPLYVTMQNVPTNVPLWIRAYLLPSADTQSLFGIYYYQNAIHWQQATPYVATSPTVIPIVLPVVLNTIFSHNNVNGMVMNEQGQGVPNTVVTAYNEAGEIVGFTTTDSNGNYHFDYLPSGEITVQVEALGIHSEIHQLVFPDIDNTFNNVNFILTNQTAIYTAVDISLPPTTDLIMTPTLTQTNSSLYLLRK